MDPNFIHQADIKIAIEAMQKAFEIGSVKAEIRIRHKDGNYIWFEMNGRRFKNIDGKLKIIVISRDISERKELEVTRNKYIQDLEKEIAEKTRKLEETTGKLQGAISNQKFLQEKLAQSEKLGCILPSSISFGFRACTSSNFSLNLGPPSSTYMSSPLIRSSS